MIWYFLYPFRGTTEPPHLGPHHPIRRAFCNHGKRTAHHWLFSLLISVTVGLLLCYPAFFLYGTPTSSTPSLPHHVWTSAKVYEGKPDTRADLEMRPIWIHGGYMKALDPKVFRDALEIQNIMIGKGFAKHSSSTSRGDDSVTGNLDYSDTPQSNVCQAPLDEHPSWGFHSPLMYWNCSEPPANTSEQLIEGINGLLSTRTFWNITLRPSSVFAGKTFVRNKIVAADALVITLFDRMGYGLGEEWNKRAGVLYESNQHRWNFYPPGGQAQHSQLYEFLFQPMSMNDNFLLSLAYFSMAVYVVISLRKIRAVKSKVGLLITVLVEMAVSILASLTICGILKINLGRIPREIHPFVVLVIGLENRFRLINAVLAHPPEMDTVNRIAQALGDVGHLSLATAAQMLIMLWLMSRVVSPDVAALCAFAAVALVFDFCFHLTFFTAVLSIDVKRMELQESLDKANLARSNSKTSRSNPRSWTDSFLQGSLPFSTRIAGTAAAICFVLTINLHFFSKEDRLQVLLETLQLRPTVSRPDATGIALKGPPIKQARTPAAWLQLQDHDTAKEIIQFVKPNAFSFIARVYEPLTIVLDHASRGDVVDQYTSVLEAMRELANNHFFPFGLLVVSIISMVTLLMNYMLYEDKSQGSEQSRVEDSVLSIQDLDSLHSLDVVRLQASTRGHLISTSLDKLVTIWPLDAQTGIYSNFVLRPETLKPPLWPIATAAVDDESGFVALCSNFAVGSGQTLAFWAIQENRLRFVSFVPLNIRKKAPLLMWFAESDAQQAGRHLVLVTADGCIADVDYQETEKTRKHSICHSTIISTSRFHSPKHPLMVATAHRNGAVFLSRFVKDRWVSTPICRSLSDTEGTDVCSKPTFLHSVAALNLLVIATTTEVLLVDIDSITVIHSFPVIAAKSSSIRLLHSQRRQCSCLGPAIKHISIAYSTREGSCVVETYTGTEKPSLLCLRPTQDRQEGCIPLEAAHKTIHKVQNAGVWESTAAQGIIGIGKGAKLPSSPSSPSENNTVYSTALSPNANVPTSQIRQRNAPKTSNTSSWFPSPPTREPEDTPDWRVWTLSSTGNFHSRALLDAPMDSSADNSTSRPLFVSKPGPMTRVGKRSVAVAMGNSIKIITSGSERFEDAASGPESPVKASKGRKKMARRNT